VLKADQALSEIIGSVASAPYALPVVDDDNKYLGVISKTVLLETLDYENEETAND
jgi:glycine betaine/proline transport system ATP-binding protein